MIINRFFHRAVVACALVILAVACNDPNPQRPLYEEDIRVLTDVMLIEGVLQDFIGEEKDSLVGLNYDVLYDRHGITESDLQALRQRFSNDPTLWSRVADSVEVRLKAGRADFETLLNAELN